MPFLSATDIHPRSPEAGAATEPSGRPRPACCANHPVASLESSLPRASAGQIELYRPPESELTPARSGRRKLWEIPHKYHCPIIGTSLSVDELRRIGERFIWRSREPMSDYGIHVGFVSAAEERNALSQATQKLLDKKYAASLRRYGKARSAAEILALWSESLAAGEVPAALWALMTHPRTDAATMVLAYEDVHMLSHQIGAGQRADLKRLSETREELARVQRQLDLVQKGAREQGERQAGEIKRLESALGERARECERLAARERDLERQLAESGAVERLQTLASLGEESQALQSRLTAAERDRATLGRHYSEAREEIQRLEERLGERDADCQALERLLALNLIDSCEDCPNDSCACRADLAGRLVLCVGGRKPLVEQYRQLVARCNGRFDHHDGGLEDSHHRLEGMLAAADAIVCATDYVSHTAYYRTKRFCKRVDKPHVLLGNSGLSAFARALERMAP